MKAKHLVTFFHFMLGWDYQWGASRWGCVDCSGAFVLAFRLFDQKIYHGSNTIWKEYLITRGTLPTPSLPAGAAVFKCREGDDYYHIGLYAGDGQVVEAKGASFGVVSSRLSDGWTHWGTLKGVEYDDSPEGSSPFPFGILEEVSVCTGGGRLNLRDTPGGTILARLENGTSVFPLLFSESWVRIFTAEGQIGWVSGEYLKGDKDPGFEEAEKDNAAEKEESRQEEASLTQDVLTEETLTLLRALHDHLHRMPGIINER